MLNQWVEQKVTVRDLYECFSQGESWRRTTGDDKSVSLLVGPGVKTV